MLVSSFALLVGGAAAAALSLPRPSAPQLWYSQGEIMALVHFNMATLVSPRPYLPRLPQSAPRPRLTRCHAAPQVMDGDPGCSTENWLVKKPYATGKSADPATFNPKK